MTHHQTAFGLHPLGRSLAILVVGISIACVGIHFLTKPPEDKLDMDGACVSLLGGEQGKISSLKASGADVTLADGQSKYFPYSEITKAPCVLSDLDRYSKAKSDLMLLEVKVQEQRLKLEALEVMYEAMKRQRQIDDEFGQSNGQ